MSSMQEYLRKLDPKYLKAMLREYCSGSDNYDAATILAVCDALAEHNPKLPDVYDAFRQLCSYYLSED